MIADGFLWEAVPPPEPVDEVRYERVDESETMLLRAGRWFVKWPYTITDCYSVRHHKSWRTLPQSVRYLDDAKLEAKRREMFGHAYKELMRVYCADGTGE